MIPILLGFLGLLPGFFLGKGAYTATLSAFLLPLFYVLVDLWRRDPNGAWRRSLPRALAVLLPSGWGLGYLFGGVFFKYPNPEAVLGVGLQAPAGMGHTFVPAEEFVFYLAGFACMASVHVWWTTTHPRPLPPSPRTFPPLALAGPVVGAGLVYRYGMSEGFPGYAAFLLLVGGFLLPPVAWRYRDRLRWDALAYTGLFTIPLSIVWEGVLAIPRGWWGYVPGHMLGIFVVDGLPVEAVAVWGLGALGSGLLVTACADA